MKKLSLLFTVGAVLLLAPLTSAFAQATGVVPFLQARSLVVEHPTSNPNDDIPHNYFDGYYPGMLSQSSVSASASTGVGSSGSCTADFATGTLSAAATASPEQTLVGMPARGNNSSQASAALVDRLAFSGPFAAGATIPVTFRGRLQGAIQNGTSAGSGYTSLVDFYFYGGRFTLRLDAAEGQRAVDEVVSSVLWAGPGGAYNISAGLTTVVYDSGSANLNATVWVELPEGFSFRSERGLLGQLNHPPTANPQTVTTTTETPVNITLTGSDPDGDNLQFLQSSQPAHGGLGISGSNVFYYPFPGFTGSDSFTFQVFDGLAVSERATVSITVVPANAAPVAVADSYTTDEDSGLLIASPGVLANDTDADEGTLIRYAFGGWVRASTNDADFTTGQRFTGYYEADPAAVRNDHPDPTLTSQYFSSAARWEIAFPDRGYRFQGIGTFVAAGNDTTFGDRFLVTMGRGGNIGTALPSGRQFIFAQMDLQDARTDGGADLLTDDSIQPTTIRVALASNPTGRVLFQDNSQTTLVFDRLTGPKAVVSASGNPAAVGSAITLASGATLRMNANGSFRYDPRGHLDHLAAGAVATDGFAYEMSDPEGATASATVTITIVGLNDAPVADSQSVTTAEDTPVAITLTGSDVDGDALTLGVVNGPAHGTANLNSPTLIYTPEANFHGTDTITFLAHDGQAFSAPATITITVTPVNHPPVADSQAVSTMEDTAVEIALTGSDPDGDPLGFAVASGPAHGTLSGTPPQVTYNPAPDYHGPDAFSFAVTDGQGGSATATVHVTVVDVVMALASISPPSALADGPSFTLTASGSNFEPDTVVYWNGSARPTAFVSPTQVRAQILASDLAGITDIQTVSVRVGEPTGPESATAIFAIVPTSVGEVQTSVVPAGDSATVSSLPVSSTQPGVTASVQNNGGDPVTIVVATYATNPIGETAFDVESESFVDVQFQGADSADVATVSFYYPASVSGGAEDTVKLRYFDGVNWIQVLSSSGVAPVKNTTDNLDGTVSGGRFTVVFDTTSNPQITELNGSIFSMAVPVSTPPAVLVCRAGYQLKLSWPTNATGFLLQSASTLANGGDWQDRMDLSPSQTNGQNVVSVNPTSPAAFFRLRQP